MLSVWDVGNFVVASLALVASDNETLNKRRLEASVVSVENNTGDERGSRCGQVQARRVPYHFLVPRSEYQSFGFLHVLYSIILGGSYAIDSALDHLATSNDETRIQRLWGSGLPQMQQESSMVYYSHVFFTLQNPSGVLTTATELSEGHDGKVNLIVIIVQENAQATRWV
ncbi:hypothetical protein M408DRAFT_22266 [Serendipita vermifera MAFF 305830]|uniref:Uncharacterized protein n=1 Tax=Serendipita vermifera MAFF 305830 TaxID=933852 RepID=A0A0C3BDP5_SERVB|nr:hypothetical protein M408DRAFT_22266 [Serendipita vermifera MAFF 305830]